MFHRPSATGFAKGDGMRMRLALFVTVLTGCAGQPAQQPAERSAAPAASAANSANTAAPAVATPAAGANDEGPNSAYVRQGYKPVRYQDGYVYCREDTHVGSL